jgi:hypothetical protein
VSTGVRPFRALGHHAMWMRRTDWIQDRGQAQRCVMSKSPRTVTQGTGCCQERYIRQRVPAAARQLSHPVHTSTVGSQSVAIFYIDSTSPIQVLHPRQPCQKCSPGSLLSLFLQASLLTVYVPLLRLKGDTTNIYSGKHPIQGILTWKTRPPFSPLRAWMTQVEPSYRSTTAS